MDSTGIFFLCIFQNKHSRTHNFDTNVQFFSITILDVQMSNKYIEIRGGLNLFINLFHVPAYIRLVSLNKHLVDALIAERERTSITVYLENREKRNEKLILIRLSTHRLRWSLLNAITPRVDYLEDIYSFEQ